MTLKEWFRRQSLRHEGRSKFKQDGSYKPKEKNANKEDWRRRKGFAKDQSKNRVFCKCGKYLKKLGNRADRRYVKRLIKKGKFDDIYYHQDMWVSNWDAC